MKIARHRLRTADAQKALVFYQQKFGMKLKTEKSDPQKKYYWLSFTGNEDAILELAFDHQAVPLSVSPQPSRNEGYWKFAVSVPDLNLTRACLLKNGVEVNECEQVPDVAYLCHLQDPDGYCIELIQHTFQKNTQSYTMNTDYPLGSPATFNLSTLRVRDINASLQFYRSAGLVLLSRQEVKKKGMTLYFLAEAQEDIPSKNVDAINIREWLWQRPFTLLELQHIHGTEQQPGFAYHVGDETGFLGLDILVNHPDQLPLHLPHEKQSWFTEAGQVAGIVVHDPDGYTLRFYCEK